ncbi:methionyl-tRNA formyltransferase Fmt [Clostridium sporogenes]|nr:formyltransferase family protein [Clostridium sporogenes]SUY61132.1 methionyl-tRNA formyltransferase Fmt [Clostridium sporogenes]
MKISNKITLFIMNEKGYSVLEKIINEIGNKIIDKVISYTDKNVVKDYYCEIKELCYKNEIKFYNKDEIFSINTKYSFAIGWRWIIKDANNLIVLHDSILPKYRGFSPLVNALINGEKELGVTALFASSNYDEGDIIDQKTINITYPIKIAQAIKIISSLYSDIVIELCEKINDNKKIDSIKQDNNNATYSLWRDSDDYFINWNDDATKIKRFVDAVGFPYNGAKALLDNKIVIIDDIDIEDDVIIENRDVGKVIFIKMDCLWLFVEKDWLSLKR